MNENTFIAVGRIERIMSNTRGLTLVIGGTGPVKSLVSVQLRDPALIKVVTHQGSGFAAGDVISISGKLEYDCETHQNVAIAAPDRVSRIARGVNIPSPAAPASRNLFGHCPTPVARAESNSLGSAPPTDPGFPVPLEGVLVGLSDVPL
ncbi:MAG: hypothetical protein K2X55_11940 [Burkholderiaceae bacterium]|nr:hypothetical protein [Burkholderiaceae bacterium]